MAFSSPVILSPAGVGERPISLRILPARAPRFSALGRPPYQRLVKSRMLAPNLLAQSDPDVWNAIRLENQRQEDHVELIASENYVSRQVLIAQGSQLTNKYAEGYPGKRYYGGCEYVDLAESLAIERAKKLFGAPWANVQAHSGSQAN